METFILLLAFVIILSSILLFAYALYIQQTRRRRRHRHRRRTASPSFSTSEDIENHAPDPHPATHDEFDHSSSTSAPDGPSSPSTLSASSQSPRVLSSPSPPSGPSPSPESEMPPYPGESASSDMDGPGRMRAPGSGDDGGGTACDGPLVCADTTRGEDRRRGCGYGRRGRRGRSAREKLEDVVDGVVGRMADRLVGGFTDVTSTSTNSTDESCNLGGGCDDGSGQGREVEMEMRILTGLNKETGVGREGRKRRDEERERRASMREETRAEAREWGGKMKDV
ncbi:MAG: hypothetical protein M1827_000252 [Pycnora praestabilis]|nr:MAG: hypothetical protein M1827_000252 [Pycnora praestabilis]